jgi:hypothetical protein
MIIPSLLNLDILCSHKLAEVVRRRGRYTCPQLQQLSAGNLVIVTCMTKERMSRLDVALESRVALSLTDAKQMFT